MAGKTQAIFFDFDGVIINSNRIKTDAFKALFQSYPQEVIDQVVSHHIRHGGISRVEKIEYVFKEILNRPLKADELETRATEYSALVVRKVLEASWIPGAIDFLKSCPKQLHKFVISGTPEKELKHIIKTRGIEHYFDDILGSPVKKPLHIQQLLSHYTLDKTRCVFIGDAFTDYDAAAECGLMFIGIQGDVQFPAGTPVLDDFTKMQQTLDLIFHR